MAMASSTTTPHFRLLLHGHDGSIPYLTPELMRLVFCPDESDNSSDDWKWHRQHFILGVAVKDTCVTAVYREASSQKKRKNGQEDEGTKRHAKRSKKEQPSSDATSENASKSEASPSASDKETTGADNGSQDKKSVDNAKKPAGYTFLNHFQSSQICKEIIEHKDIATAAGNGQNNTSSYMQTHLRIPKYISTMIVPTFSLDYPNIAVDSSEKGGATEKTPKKQPINPKPTKQKQKQQNKKDVIPNSTKDTMPVDTPHGWQKLRPEQYWDAVLSLTLPSTTMPTSVSATTTTSTSKPSCEGAVGLFDHMGINRDHINHLFAQVMMEKNNGDINYDANNDNDVLTPQAQKSSSLSGATAPKIGKWSASLQRLVQRTNDWSFRTRSYWEQLDGPMKVQSLMNFWTPVHMTASQLALDSLFALPRSRLPSQEHIKQQTLSNCSNVAIVGWDSISYNRKCRRQVLHNLMTTMQSSPTPPKHYSVLAVNDLQSILDAAREGISIIGTDVVRQWSRSGRALHLDLTLDNGANNGKADDTTMGGKMNLVDEQYARDSSPLLPGCQCLACRPRQNDTNNDSNGNKDQTNVPSFTRAYIHHLIKAKEMIAETLLFVHNLHQILLLFRQLSKAAYLDEGVGDCEERNLESFCQKIEEQLYA